MRHGAGSRHKPCGSDALAVQGVSRPLQLGMARGLHCSIAPDRDHVAPGIEQREPFMEVGKRTSIEAPSADEESIEDVTESHVPMEPVEEPDSDSNEHAPVEEPVRPRSEREPGKPPKPSARRSASKTSPARKRRR